MQRLLNKHAVVVVLFYLESNRNPISSKLIDSWNKIICKRSPGPTATANKLMLSGKKRRALSCVTHTKGIKKNVVKSPVRYNCPNVLMVIPLSIATKKDVTNEKR